jgi:hypothetical protein
MISRGGIDKGEKIKHCERYEHCHQIPVPVVFQKKVPFEEP